LRELTDRESKDFTVPIASALVAIATGESSETSAALAALKRRLDETPLGSLSPSAKPNARQRAEAAAQLPLWLVARACWKNEELRSLGDSFANRAVDAALRQLDHSWYAAMLHEWGRLAIDRGDRATAELHWGQWLEFNL